MPNDRSEPIAYEPLLENGFPQPVVSVSISTPDVQSTAEPLQVKALLDPGADMTVVNQSLVEALDLPLIHDDRNAMLVTGTGTSRGVAVYSVRVEFPAGNENEIPAILLDVPYLIVGRDILDRLRILFDGPGQTWSLQ